MVQMRVLHIECGLTMDKGYYPEVGSCSQLPPLSTGVLVLCCLSVYMCVCMCVQKVSEGHDFSASRRSPVLFSTGLGVLIPSSSAHHLLMLLLLEIFQFISILPKFS